MKDVTPTEAHSLLQSRPDALFLDVRSRAEFQAGHPAGSINVPIAEPDAAGTMTPNPNFAGQVRALAPEADRCIVVSCLSGARSRRAGEALEGMGYGEVVNVVSGFGGTRTASGQAIPGWRDSHLPIAFGG